MICIQYFHDLVRFWPRIREDISDNPSILTPSHELLQRQYKPNVKFWFDLRNDSENCLGSWRAVQDVTYLHMRNVQSMSQ